MTGLSADRDVGVGEKRLEGAQGEIGGGDVLERVGGGAADDGIIVWVEGSSDIGGVVRIEE